MKNILLSSVFAIFATVAFSTTVTITNSGTTFSPNTVTIQVGDTVNFNIASSHNAIEVSQATWNANGNTLLPGFSVDFGGGLLTGLTAGTHYYVCAPHASVGMKGKIIVTTPTGINNLMPGNTKFSIFPNPTTGIFTIQSKGSATQTVEATSMVIYNFKGERIYSLPILNEHATIDFSFIPAGTYFIRINDKVNIYTQKIVKQ